MAWTIDDPSAYFNTVLYTGNDTNNRSITGVNFQPDLTWIKQRATQVSDNVLCDSNRGTNKKLASNTVAAEVSPTQYGGVGSFDADGFTLVNGTDTAAGSLMFEVNKNSETYVAWNWKANGGTTSSNTSGSITSTVQADTTAGFSIVTWTGNAQNATIGHGLGATPQVIISKALGTTNDWNVYHRWTDNTAPYNYTLPLHSTASLSAATGSYGSSLSDVNSTTFYKKYWINYNTDMIAYCFAEKQGYSRFGVYYGNGNASGQFVYTGFKPGWVVFRDMAGGGWFTFDNKRDTYNAADARLALNDFAVEATGGYTNVVDFLSNGFKLRNTDTAWNGLSRRYIYMAFAENPFVTSTGVPTTAR